MFAPSKNINKELSSVLDPIIIPDIMNIIIEYNTPDTKSIITIPYGDDLKNKVKVKVEIENENRCNNIKLAAILLTTDSKLFNNITDTQWDTINNNTRIMHHQCNIWVLYDRIKDVVISKNEYLKYKRNGKNKTTNMINKNILKDMLKTESRKLSQIKMDINYNISKILYIVNFNQ